MKLYLVRHGQSTGNIGGVLMGQSDHPLTELGEAQARAAAARLAPFGPMPVHCSDLPRARATAEYVAAAWAAAAAIFPDPRLREIDLGDYEGRSWEEFGGVTDASVSATGFFTPEPGAAACIVSHDGPMRALLNHYLGVPPEKWWTLSTTHGGVSLLEFAGGWVNVRYVNEL